MLHEILYALIGYTGDVIILQNERFIVNPALYRPNSMGHIDPHTSGVLSAAEAELINKIVSLGLHFKLIKEFVERYSGLSSSLALHLAYGADKGKADNHRGGKKEEEHLSDEAENLDYQLSGVYIKAFCSGVNELITVYKEHILAIEQEFLKDRSLTVLSLIQKFGIYF